LIRHTPVGLMYRIGRTSSAYFTYCIIRLPDIVKLRCAELFHSLHSRRRNLVN